MNVWVIRSMITPENIAGVATTGMAARHLLSSGENVLSVENVFYHYDELLSMRVHYKNGGWEDFAFHRREVSDKEANSISFVHLGHRREMKSSEGYSNMSGDDPSEAMTEFDQNEMDRTARPARSDRGGRLVRTDGVASYRRLYEAAHSTDISSKALGDCTGSECARIGEQFMRLPKGVPLS